MAAETLMEGEAEAITRKAIELAKEGDGPALRLCMDRIYPPRKDRPVRFRLPSLDKVEDAVAAHAAIVQAKANGARWCDKVAHGIRLPDGKGVYTRGDKHPDPLVEKVRWQICEGELMQSLGRVRGINRTASDPVQIDILTNVALPVTADEVVTWGEAQAQAGEVMEMMMDGVVLHSPRDMAKCFPHVWETTDSAKSWIKRARRGEAFPGQTPLYELLKGNCPGNNASWHVIRYRPIGRGQQIREAAFDLDVILDPRAWLEARLGRLAQYDGPRCEVRFERHTSPRRIVLSEVAFSVPDPSARPCETAPAPNLRARACSSKPICLRHLCNLARPRWRSGATQQRE